MATKKTNGDVVDTATGEVLQPAVAEATQLEPAPEKGLPVNWKMRGATEAQWRTMFNLFPGAHPASVLMAWDYCVARQLDPLKKPCHIVKMSVKNHKSQWEERDVIMPGIYEYRTTAHRTGQYLGHAKPEFGPLVSFEHLGIKKPVPESITFTVYRWNPLSQQRAEFSVTVWFDEVCNVNKRGDRAGMANEKWTKSPIQMLTIRGESAGLREGFPDELGGTHIAEEMEGRYIDASGGEENVIDAVASPPGYGAWFDSLVAAARGGAAALTTKMQAGDLAYREHLTLKNAAAWESLKATALAVGP